MVSIHVLTAGFFLAAAIMFAVTGGLYTFGIKGGYETEKFPMNLTLPADPSLPELEAEARKILSERGIAKPPSGSPGLRRVVTSWQFDWSGVDYEFSLEPTTTAGVYTAAIKKTDSHRFFVQLHKAKGGWPFKVLAGALAIGFVSLFAGGAMLAFSQPKLKRQFYVSFFIGTIVFIFAALGS